MITTAFSHPTFASGGQPTVTETVMAGIRALLITGALAPGSRIDQIELARRFDVSIVPIREALARLASVGLVEIVSHRGVFVAEVSCDELVDLYTMREIVEEKAAKIAVDLLTDADIDKLQNVADAMAVAAKKKDLERFLMLNRDLHFTLYRASKRRYMLQIIEQMWDLSARYAHLQLHAVPDRASQSISEVRAIVAACRRRDREEVALLVRYKVHLTSMGLLERLDLPAQKEKGNSTKGGEEGGSTKGGNGKSTKASGSDKPRGKAAPRKPEARKGNRGAPTIS